MPASATTNKPTQEEIKEHSDLLQIIEKVGVPITFKSEFCLTTDNFGGYHVQGKELALCERGTSWDRLNTVRHEAWHVYQDLKDCNLADDGYVKPVFVVDMVPAEIRQWATKNYDKEMVNAEAEAQWAAETFNAENIALLIATQAQSCRKR